MTFRLLAPQVAVDGKGHRVSIVDRRTVSFRAPGFDVRAEAEFGSVATVYTESIVDITGRSLTDSEIKEIAVVLRDGLVAMGGPVELVPEPG
jgi:hypothetical protein